MYFDELLSYQQRSVIPMSYEQRFHPWDPMRRKQRLVADSSP